MAKGKKLRRGWKPGNPAQPSIYEDIDDDRQHDRFLSDEQRSQRLRSELIEANADANLSTYNGKMRDRIQVEKVSAPVDSSIAESSYDEQLGDLTFRKDLDEAYANFQQELASHINGKGSSHVEVDRLAAVFVAKQRQALKDYRQEHASPTSYLDAGVNAVTQKMRGYGFDFTSTGDSLKWARDKTLGDARIAVGEHYLNEIEQGLNSQIADSRQLTDNLRLLGSKEAIVVVERGSTTLATLTTEQGVQLDAINALNRQYQADLFSAMTDLDNDPGNINDLAEIHKVYKDELQQKTDAFALANPGVALQVSDGATSPTYTNVSDHMQKRFTEIRSHSQALRAEANQLYMAPKSALQHYRYGVDQQHKTTYDQIILDKAAAFEAEVKKQQAIIDALRPGVTIPPPPTVFSALVLKEPTVSDVLRKGALSYVEIAEAEPYEIFHEVTMRDYIAATPAEKAKNYAGVNYRINTLITAADKLPAEVKAASLAYLQECKAYVAHYSPAAIKKREPTFDDTLNALQSRVVALEQAYQNNDPAGIALAAEITKDLTALRKTSAAPAAYTLSTVDALPAKGTPNSFVQVETKATHKDDEPTREVYFCDAAGTATIVDLSTIAEKERNDFLGRFPALGNKPTSASLADVVAHIPAASAATASQAARIDKALGEVAKMKGSADYYRLSQEFHAISDELAHLHNQYAAEARPLLDIEYQFDAKSTKAQLAHLKDQYSALRETQLAKLAELQTSVKGDLKATPPVLAATLTAEQLKAFNEQCAALQKTQADNFTALVTEVSKQRDAADKDFDSFNRNYQWDALQRDPFDRDRHHKLTDKEIERIKALDPYEAVNQTKGNPNASVRVGFMSVQKNDDHTFSINLSQAFRGEGFINRRTGQVSHATAFWAWCSKGKYRRDVEATLTDPARMDNLGLVLDTMMKDPEIVGAKGERNTLTNCQVEYSKTNYKELLAMYVAAESRDIKYNIRADFQNSFKTEKGFSSIVYNVSDEKRARLLEKMERDVERYKEQRRDTVAINASCRELTLHGVQPGLPSKKSLDAAGDIKDRNSRHFVQAVLTLSHSDSNRDLSATDSLRHLNNINLSLVKGLVPNGGDYSGHAAALLGVALERDHFASLLVLKDRELTKLQNSAEVKRSPDLQVQCAAARQSLAQEQRHFAVLCEKYGCQADQGGRSFLAQMSQQHKTAELRDMTLKGNDVAAAKEIVEELAKLPTLPGLLDKKTDVLDELAEKLASIENAHAAERATTSPVKTLLEQLVTSEQLSDPHSFTEHTDFAAKANGVDVRMQATREEMSAEHQAAIEVLQDKHDKADLTDQPALKLQLDALKNQSSADYIKEALAAENAKASTDPAVIAKIDKLERLQLHQDQAAPLQAARTELQTAQAEKAKLVKDAAPAAVIAAAETKVKVAENALTKVEGNIQALKLPNTLATLVATLEQAKAAVSTDVKANQAIVTRELGKAKALLAKSTPPMLPKTDLAKFNDAVAAITGLDKLTPTRPEDKETQRNLLTEAKMQCNTILERQVQVAVECLNNKNPPATLAAKIEKLTQAHDIICQSGTELGRSVVTASSDQHLAAQCRTLLTELNQVRKFNDRLSLAIAAAGDSTSVATFANRDRVFDIPVNSSKAEQQLADLSTLKTELSKAVAVAKDPLAKPELTAALAKVTEYRTALIEGLKKDAARVLSEKPANVTALQSVERAFKYDGLSSAEKAAQRPPSSHVLAMIKESVAPSTIAQQAEAKIKEASASVVSSSRSTSTSTSSHH